MRYQNKFKRKSDFLSWLKKEQEKAKIEDNFARAENLSDCLPEFDSRIIDGIDCLLSEYRKDKLGNRKIWEKHETRRKRERDIHIAYFNFFFK